MKTLMIKAAVISYLDFEHNRVDTGKTETEFSKEFQDYLHKLCEKALTSSKIKKIRIGSQHELFGYMTKNLKDVGEDISAHMFTIGVQADIMPDATLVTVSATYGGDNVIIAIKTDHKAAPYNDAKNDNVRIISRQLLPASPTADEAIIVNGSEQKAYIIEKKYTVDGKNTAILNDFWIHGDADMTDAEKEKALKKVVKTAQEEKQNDMLIPKMKSVLAENAVTGAPVTIGEVAGEVLGTDSEEYLEQMEIDGDEEMTNYSSASKVTVTTDNGVKITIEADDLIEGNTVTVEDGRIVITGFEEYKIS